MFQTISYSSILLVGIGILIHAFTRPTTTTEEPKTKGKKTKSPEPATPGSWSPLASGLPLLGRIKRLAALVVVICTAALFVTGFSQRLLLSETIHGYTLMAHVAIAPPFIICLAFAALTWANRCRLTDQEWEWASNCIHGQCSPTPKDLGWKISFWIAAALALPVSLSVIAMMYPLFGTHGQHTLFEVHRYSSLAFTLVAIVHVYFFLQSRKK